MAEWKNDKELFEIMKKELYTGVLCDMLDTLGYSHVCLPNRLQPLYADRIMVGRAYPTIICVYTANRKPRLAFCRSD